MKIIKNLLGGLALCSLIVPATASAITLHTDRLSWEAASNGFLDVDIAGQLTGGDFLSTGTALDLGFGESVTFNTDMERLQVGTTWTTWNPSSVNPIPAVLYTLGVDLITAAFEPVSGIAGLGLELEPEQFDSFDMTLTLTDGSTLAQSVSGFFGSAFFGWTFAPGGPAVQSMTIGCTGTQTCGGFAIGNMVVEQPVSVPEPSTLALLAIGLIGVGVARARRRSN